MYCEHKRAWEMESVSTYSEGPRSPYQEDVIPLLEDGWEPFAVQESVYFFKRLRPCETCEAQKNELAGQAVYLKDEIKKIKKAGKSAKGLT